MLVVSGAKLTAKKSQLCHHSPYFLAMFKDHFLEENKSEIELHSVNPAALAMLIEWMKSKTIPANEPTTQEVMDLLQCAGMLQFSEVQELCVEILCTRLDVTNCWSLLQLSDILSEEKLFNRAKKYIMWNFEKTITSSDFISIDKNLMMQILKSEHLNVKHEMLIFEALLIWVGTENKGLFPDLLKESLLFDNLSEDNLKIILSHDLLKSEHNLLDDIAEMVKYKSKQNSENQDRITSRELSQEILVLLKGGRYRYPPTYPCVIGHKLAKQTHKEEKRTDDDELDDWNQMGVRASRYQDTYRAKEKSVHMFVFDPVTCKVEPFGAVTNVQDGEVEASGFKVANTGVDLVLSGGEFSLGQSNWSRSVTQWSSFRRSWEQIATMDNVRRHHTMVIMDREVYLLGGFGKHRIILDSVDSINLDTGDKRECASLPVAMYRPAAAQFRGRIFVVGKKKVMVYHPYPQNYWASLNQIGLPTDVEFDSALASDTHIYLTSAHSRELHRFDPECGDSEMKLEMVGKFSKEANNTCIVNGVIYNFNSEEFDDERVVESFDTRSNVFKVLWKRDVPEWDFSPHYCLGCFPIVDYK